MPAPERPANVTAPAATPEAHTSAATLHKENAAPKKYQWCLYWSRMINAGGFELDLFDLRRLAIVVRGSAVKDKIMVIVVAILVIVLGIQAYMLFQMNARLNQLDTEDTQAGSPLITTPNDPKPKLPKWGLDDKFYQGDGWDPYAEMQRIQHEMERLFGDSFSRFHLKSPLGRLNKTPDVDLEEKPDRFIVTVNVPGADESSLNVKLEGQQLQVSIKTEHAENQTDGQNSQYQYRERFVGEFHRTLTLPKPADAAKMKTDLHNGVLTITVPKA